MKRLARRGKVLSGEKEPTPDPTPNLSHFNLEMVNGEVRPIRRRVPNDKPVENRPRLTMKHKKTRDTVLYLFSRGYSQREIAREIGINEGNIRLYRTKHPEFDQQCRAHVDARLTRLREKAIDAVDVHLDRALEGLTDVRPAIIRALFRPSEVKVVDTPPPDTGAETLLIMNDARERVRKKFEEVLGSE